MYIEPNTTLKLLTDVPLSPSYENTYYFSSLSEQEAFFSSKAVYTFNDLSYLRIENGVIKLQLPVSQSYNLSYMMFKNSAYSDKWFYAFITKTEYLSNETTVIYFEQDYLQSWFFDFDFLPCFIDREHSATDELFENTIPENIGYGEYVCNDTDFEGISDLSPDGLILMATEKPDGTREDSSLCYGIPTPFYVICSSADGFFPDTGLVYLELDEFVKNGKEDAIISVYSMPRFTGYKGLITKPPESPVTLTITTTKNTETIDGYTPKNKKLFSHPYNLLWISNRSGSISEYKYELFSTSDCEFECIGVGVPTPSYTITPMWYKGCEKLYEESLSVSGFPPLPFVGDIYAAYMALNRNSLAYAQQAPIERANFNAVSGLANSAISTTLNAAVGNYLGAGLSVVNGALSAVTSSIQGKFESDMVKKQQLAQQLDIQNTPEKVHGLVDSISPLYASNKMRPVAMKMTIKKEYAEIIDDYFTRYGYKTNKVKIPNTNVRQSFTYVKTIGCVITGDVPADVSTSICSIMDSGVTFWSNRENIGNYEVDNGVIQ